MGLRTEVAENFSRQQLQAIDALDEIDSIFDLLEKAQQLAIRGELAALRGGVFSEKISAALKEAFDKVNSTFLEVEEEI